MASQPGFMRRRSHKTVVLPIPEDKPDMDIAVARIITCPMINRCADRFGARKVYHRQIIDSVILKRARWDSTVSGVLQLIKFLSSDSIGIISLTEPPPKSESLRSRFWRLVA